MAGNYYNSSQHSMFPYTGGDHHSQSNQHHGNYMNGTSHENYLNSHSGNHQMFNNHNNNNNNYNQNNSFFSSNHNQQNSNDQQSWNKQRGHNNYNRNADHYDASINKLSSGVNQMSIDSSNRNDVKINKSESSSTTASNKSALLASSKLQQHQNAKQQQQQQQQQQQASSKAMSWASIASQPAKAQPKSFKSKLATVVLSTSTTKHVPPPMPPVAQISLDEIEPITNPWAKNSSNKKDELGNDDYPPAHQHQNRMNVDNSYNNNRNNKLDENHPSRDYNAQHNHKQYNDQPQQQRFDPQQQQNKQQRYPAPSNNNRFDNNQMPQQPPPSNQRQFDNRPPHNNDRFNNQNNNNRNNNGLNNSYNSHGSRQDNMRDPRDSNYQQRDNFNNNQQQSNYMNNNSNYNNRNYGGNQNYGNNNQNKYQNQRPQYNQQNYQNQRPGGHMYQQQQQPPQQFPSKPIQLTEQQEAQQEKEAQALLEKLRSENNYNPDRLELNQKNAKFFIIKSYSEDDIHRSIKYSIWCSTEHGNMKLDNAFKEQINLGPVYLFYSVNGSGHFCGVAQMVSPVDYNASSGVWAQDKWKGQFKVKWIYVKDVPNVELRHIVLENNDFKPVTNSRDTQEVPPEKGRVVLDIIHAHKHKTSIFDDFFFYERKQYEELLASRSHRMIESPPMSSASSNTSSRPHYNQPSHHYNKQRQTNDQKIYHRDTSSPVDLNESNNSKGSLISSNYEPSSTGSNIKRSWAEQCD